MLTQDDSNFYSNSHDLDKRKTASKKLARSVQPILLFDLCMDHIQNGVILTDPEGKIIFLNKAYGQFLGLEPRAQVGKHVADVIENTRMHVVAQTERAEINETQVIRGQNIVVQRIPIRNNGKLVAVFGQVMFKDAQDVHKLAKRLSVMETKVKMYEEELLTLRANRYTIESLVGESAAIKALRKQAYKAAATNLAVLITGESGVGKEICAQSIHNAGPRRLGAFVRVNSSAIPKDLLEAELFGYEKGAFTGARVGGKPGKFELAHHGTIFLDEIGDLPLSVQPKLLRVLEEKEVERIGGTRPVRSDFRLIAATNQNLEEMVEKNLFRADLFYRLNVIPIHVPPLRQRTEDIIPQAELFLQQIAREWGKGSLVLSPDAKEVLGSYHWPGNTRELLNIVQRIAASLEGETIRLCDLPYHLFKKKKCAMRSRATLLKEIVAEAEKEAICSALDAVGYNKARAADLLGIHRTLLYKKMKSLGITSEEAS